jgi:hypothetical protein
MPLEPPKAAAGGLVFPALSDQRRFEVVSVAADDGRIRWRASASPSRIDHGVGHHIDTVQDGRTVLWMEPGRVYRDGDVSVVAADAATGARRWSYGAGQIRLTSAPSPCRGQTAVCFVAYSGGSQPPRSVVLNANSGRVVAQGSPPFEGSVRSIADGLYAAGGLLAGVDDHGQLLWHRSLVDAFGAKVDPDYGWNIELRDNRYVGSLGRVRSSGDSATTRIKLQDLAVTAALDAKTGRTLWTRPRSSVFCGQLTFDLAHPVVCEGTGAVNADGTNASGLDTTVAGINPATGKNRWQAHVGAVQGLVHGCSDVIRTGNTTYTLRTTDGVVGLDLDRGVRKAAGADAGWCTADASVTPVQNVEGVNPNGVAAYSVDRWYPCRLGGTALDRPAHPEGFAGATVGGVFAYTTMDGTLHAVKVR